MEFANFLENQKPILNDFLMLHQSDAVIKSRVIPYLGLFFEVGCGKTYTGISILLDKTNENKKHLKPIVLGPKSILTNWAREIIGLQNQLGIPYYLQYQPLVLDQDSSSKKLKYLKSKITNRSIVIANYETLQNEEIFEFLKACEFDIGFCDESQRLKNPLAQRTKKAMSLFKTIKYSYIMTGTPVLNNPMDIWSQIYILDKGKHFGDNFYVFRARYFIDLNAGMPTHVYFPNWQLRESAVFEFHDILSKITVKAKRDDVLDLPPLIKETRYVKLSSEQAKHYDSMMKEFVTFIQDKLTTETKAVVASLALTKLLKLQQIISGFMVDDQGVTHRLYKKPSENPKLEILRDILEDTVLEERKKVIIWSTFKEDHRAICDLIKEITNCKQYEHVTFAQITGDISDKQAEIDLFQKDPNCIFMVANAKAGGVGVNLQEASYAIYYSKNYSLEEDIQSEARCYRKGSEKHSKVVRIDLVAQHGPKETVDELINEALKSKQAVSDLILDYALKSNLQALDAPTIQKSIGYSVLDMGDLKKEIV